MKAQSNYGSRPRRVYVVKWKFSVGHTVIFGGQCATVIWRQRSLLGREIYDLYIVGPHAGCRYKTVFGEALGYGRHEKTPPFDGRGLVVRRGWRPLFRLPPSNHSRPRRDLALCTS